MLLDLTDQEKKSLLRLQSEYSPRTTEYRYYFLKERSLTIHLLFQSGVGHIAIKLLADGKQQVINFHLVGDIIGPYAMVFKEADHSVKTVTDTELFKIVPEELLELVIEIPPDLL